MISDVKTVRIDATAEASFALIRERNRFGIATAAMIRMIATTISNSINENPPSLRLILRRLLSISRTNTCTRSPIGHHKQSPCYQLLEKDEFSWPAADCHELRHYLSLCRSPTALLPIALWSLFACLSDQRKFLLPPNSTAPPTLVPTATPSS